MLNSTVNKFQKKSLKERFLLVIGVLLFLVYLVLGLIVIFWKEMPISMPTAYRIAFGVILIVYSFVRFLRFFKSND